MTRPPLRTVRFAALDPILEDRDDGSFVFRSARRLGEIEPSVGCWLDRWARERPDAIFLTEPAGPTRRCLSYGVARARVRRIAAGLLERGSGPQRPVVILSSNGIDHALLSLAAQYVGVPVVPVSAAWTVLSDDAARVASVIEQTNPAVVFADDPDRYAAGLLHASPQTIVTDLAALAASEEVSVDAAAAGVVPETIAKILFTSGSTGTPKGVLNPHRMLTANQAMIAAVWPFVEDEPPVLVDWLPWNHTFGGNHNFNLVLRNGGTLHIDPGRPTPDGLGPTLDALREVAPTVYFNVPAGFAALLPHLESDATLAARFFSRVRVVFYAGASLPADLWSRLEALAVRTVGERPAMASGWGSTETAPAATTVHADIDRAGIVGWPAPGSEIRMLPLPGEDGRYELRVRGPHVTPGYLGRPDLTAAAFDDEGFYKIGDAGRFAVAGDPLSGLVFDGRVAEDFKLLSGTWVRAGIVRPAALAACDGFLRDALVAGRDRAEIGLLAWPNLEVARARGIDQAELGPLVARRLGAWGEGKGSSERVGRLLLLDTPPDAAAGEITDKGYVNQRRGLELRAADEERLFTEPRAPGVLVVPRVVAGTPVVPPEGGSPARRSRVAELAREHAGLLAFFGGFAYDSLTLRRIDKVFDNVLLAIYLGVLGLLLVLERRLHWSRPVPGFVANHAKGLDYATQFLFGGLFSAYAVFYFKSAGGAGSLGFMLLLAVIMVLNEFGDGAIRRLETFRLGLYFFTAFSFFQFAIPTFTGNLGRLLWIPSALAAAGGVYAVVLATHAGGEELPKFMGGTTLRERLVFHTAMMVAITGAIAVASSSGWIPPVPLSVTDRVVAHDVERTETGYRLIVDRGNWLRRVTLRPPKVTHEAGAPVVVFTAVFAPRGSATDVFHRWQRREAEEWVDTEPEPIEVSVVGGRDGGFRTYTRKRNVVAGDWRVRVETADERVVGIVRFEVVPAEGDPKLETITR